MTGELSLQVFETLRDPDRLVRAVKRRAAAGQQQQQEVAEAPGGGKKRLLVPKGSREEVG